MIYLKQGLIQGFHVVQYQERGGAKKVHLNWCYMLDIVYNRFISVKTSVIKTIMMLDHYPILTSLGAFLKKVHFSWFHTDPQLFNIPSIQRDLQSIWEKTFSSSTFLARARSQAVTETQTFLVRIRKQATQIKEKRRKDKYAKLIEVESNGKGSIETQDEIPMPSS